MTLLFSVLVPVLCFQLLLLAPGVFLVPSNRNGVTKTCTVYVDRAGEAFWGLLHGVSSKRSKRVGNRRHN